MGEFKIGDEVKWNGKKDNNLIYWNELEEFLKSKEIHTIKRIKNIGFRFGIKWLFCKLEGSEEIFDLTWFDLIEG